MRISIINKYSIIQKRGWGLERPKGERTTRYTNIHHLSQTISSPFFPHTSQTFPCEAQVPLNSPPLRNISLTDINIKNKEINPIVISTVIISINIPKIFPKIFFNKWGHKKIGGSCSKIYLHLNHNPPHQLFSH